MGYPTKILFPEKITELVIKSGQDVSPGDLLGYSSGWVLADADAATNVYAQYIALQGGSGGKVIKACQKCLLFDEDAPWTANTAQYVSGTAGETTETRPATDGDLIQIVGRSLDTTRCLIDIQAPKEFELFIPVGTFDAQGAVGAIEGHTIDAGWEGILGDTAAIAGYVTGRLPSGLISLDVADLMFDMTSATALDIDFTLVQAYKGATNTGTGTTVTAAATTETAADNKILRVSVLSAFDASVVLPGKFFCGKVDPDGGAGHLLGLSLRGFKV